MLAVVNMDGNPSGWDVTPLVYVYTLDGGGKTPTKITDFIDRGGGKSSGSGPVFIGHTCQAPVADVSAADVFYGIKGISWTRWPSYPASGYGGCVYYADTIYPDPAYLGSDGMPYQCYCVVADRFVAKGNYHSTSDGKYVLMISAIDLADPVVPSGYYGAGAFKGHNYQVKLDKPLASGAVCGYVRSYLAERYPFGSSYYRQSSYTVRDEHVRYLAEKRYPPELYNFWLGRTSGMPGSIGDVSIAPFVKAFYMAVDKLPDLQSNFIANVLDAVSLLRSFKAGYKSLPSIKETLQSLWLGYRYSYNTTISDLEDATKCIERLLNVGKSIRSYGAVIQNGIKYMCSISVSTDCWKIVDDKSLTRFLNTRPSLTNLWDIIPYSFVVDWFLGISGVLEAFDQWLEVPEFPILEIWYSFSYNDPDDPNVRCYGRWLGNKPSLPYVDHHSASDRTITLRVADTLALFT